MDWSAIGNYVLLVGSFVAMVTMFNQSTIRWGASQRRADRRKPSIHEGFGPCESLSGVARGV